MVNIFIKITFIYNTMANFYRNYLPVIMLQPLLLKNM